MGRKRLLGTVEELKARRTIKFGYKEEGIPREAFVAYFGGQIVCYQNVCRHVPITLDYGDGQFFTPDGGHFICQTHGATYEAGTGICVAGPCVGASLKKLTVQLVRDEIWFEEPA